MVPFFFDKTETLAYAGMGMDGMEGRKYGESKGAISKSIVN